MKEIDWSKLVGSACFTCCMHVHKATGYTLVQVFLGWDLVPPIVQAYKLKALCKAHEQKVILSETVFSEEFSPDLDKEESYLDDTAECKFSVEEFSRLDYDNKLETN